MTPNSLKPYACNRIAEIQTLTSSHEWRYVPTLENLADLVSGGLSFTLRSPKKNDGGLVHCT